MRAILVAVDLGPQSMALVRYGFALGDRADSKVHVLHVYRPSVIPTSRGGSETWAELRRSQCFDDLHRASLEALRELTAEFLVSNARGKLLAASGHAASGIVSAARELEADLLVIGRRSRLGSGASLLGNVTHEVIRSATVPVLVLNT